MFRTEGSGGVWNEGSDAWLGSPGSTRSGVKRLGGGTHATGGRNQGIALQSLTFWGTLILLINAHLLAFYRQVKLTKETPKFRWMRYDVFRGVALKRFFIHTSFYYDFNMFDL